MKKYHEFSSKVRTVEDMTGVDFESKFELCDKNYCASDNSTFDVGILFKICKHIYVPA